MFVCLSGQDFESYLQNGLANYGQIFTRYSSKRGKTFYRREPKNFSTRKELWTFLDAEPAVFQVFPAQLRGFFVFYWNFTYQSIDNDDTYRLMPTLRRLVKAAQSYVAAKSEFVCERTAQFSCPKIGGLTVSSDAYKVQKLRSAVRNPSAEMFLLFFANSSLG